MPRASTTPAKVAGISDAAVLKATGKSWHEWLRALDRLGAKQMDHKSIASMVDRKFPAIGGWWGQMVTVGYEQARGLRVPMQKSDGFSAGASKTIAAPVESLYAAWSDKRRRARWLPDAPLEVTKATASKSVRARWTTDDTRVDVNLYAKGADKSMVQVQHARLPSAKAAQRMKAFWGGRLLDLKAQLEK